MDPLEDGNCTFLLFLDVSDFKTIPWLPAMEDEDLAHWHLAIPPSHSTRIILSPRLVHVWVPGCISFLLLLLTNYYKLKWFKTIEIYSLTVQDTEISFNKPKSKCQQGQAPPGDSVQKPFPTSSSFWWQLASLGLWPQHQRSRPAHSVSASTLPLPPSYEGNV
jgi:hypothetical protein